MDEKKYIKLILKSKKVKREELEKLIVNKIEEYRDLISKEGALFLIAQDFGIEINTNQNQENKKLRRHRKEDKDASPLDLEKISLYDILEEKYFQMNKYQPILDSITRADIELLINKLPVTIYHYLKGYTTLIPFLLEDKIDLLTLLFLLHLLKTKVFDLDLDLVGFKEPWNEKEERIMNSFEITDKLIEYWSLEADEHYKEGEDQEYFIEKSRELSQNIKKFYSDLSENNPELLKDHIKYNIEKENLVTVLVILRLRLFNLLDDRELKILFQNPQSNWLIMFLKVFLNSLIYYQPIVQWRDILKMEYEFSDLWFRFVSDLLESWGSKKIILKGMVIETISKLLNSQSLYYPFKKVGLIKLMKKLDEDKLFTSHIYTNFIEGHHSKIEKILEKQFL